ncbi:TetR family transcriptional regulator [Pseudonocardia sp. HH130630-07]|uniref:TetR family transcriptional regulator n=1 Tax=Pseudonocardia sp. HH130630-07 TaxID=1690815 RepID=UPI00081508AF|nr:TetR family transcriptional regulator [Pseudonocardia sp. HH130630-07]ANY09142.1 TetR family transcriptional regulator [Pseudonocardia sp. HH130630-07]
MPRRKQVPDSDVLDVALDVLHTRGPQALTFAALAEASALAPATLVQRFGSKPALLRRVLLHAWDRLEHRTASLAAEVDRTPAGAVTFLVGLSAQYGDRIDDYADALLVLREDLIDPESRRRGTAWRGALAEVLDACLGGPPGLGDVVATYWQGTLTWWGFDPREPVTAHVERELTGFLDRVLSPPAGSARAGSRTGP